MNYKKAPCTIAIIAANIAVFVWLTFFGRTEDAEYMLNHGAMYVPYVLEQGEYYRIFTSMFLHFGITHLGNNMLILFATGSVLESELGSIKFAILYILSGLGGNVLSSYMDIRTGEFAVSAGASGAVFGVIGALLYVAIRNKGKVGTLTSKGILLMMGLSLYFGFTSSGVDNLAHVGGLVCGFILALLLYWKRNRKFSTDSL